MSKPEQYRRNPSSPKFGVRHAAPAIVANWLSLPPNLVQVEPETVLFFFFFLPSFQSSSANNAPHKLQVYLRFDLAAGYTLCFKLVERPKPKPTLFGKTNSATTLLQKHHSSTRKGETDPRHAAMDGCDRRRRDSCRLGAFSVPPRVGGGGASCFDSNLGPVPPTQLLRRRTSRTRQSMCHVRAVFLAELTTEPVSWVRNGTGG